jgi:hypothetical protein
VRDDSLGFFPFAFDPSGSLLQVCLFSAAKNKLGTGLSLTGVNPQPDALTGLGRNRSFISQRKNCGRGSKEQTH